MQYKYGDLVIKCHQCGGEELLESNVTDGRGIYLFTDTDSYFKMHCPVCNISMEIAFKPSVNAPEEDIIEEATIVETDEKLQTEVTAEETV